MLTRHVNIKNISSNKQRLDDFQLPNGTIELEPGEITTIPAPVYGRVARRAQFWMQNMDAITVKEEETNKVEIEPEIEPIQLFEFGGEIVQYVKTTAKRVFYCTPNPDGAVTDLAYVDKETWNTEAVPYEVDVEGDENPSTNEDEKQED